MVAIVRLNQYAALQVFEIDEITSSNNSFSGVGTFFSAEFSENIGITTTLRANTYKPYDLITADFGFPSYGPGNGTYVRINTDKSVIVYNEIDEVTTIY